MSGITSLGEVPYQGDDSRHRYSIDMDWDQLARNARDFVEGMAASGYRRRLRGQAIELNDLFLLLCYMDLLGLPNPAALYLFEVYPYFLDELHLWHRRMGMDRSPLADFSCC